MDVKVGYVAASIRSVADARVGDTITNAANKAITALPGYQEATPMVFCGLFPVDADQYVLLSPCLFIYNIHFHYTWSAWKIAVSFTCDHLYILYIWWFTCDNITDECR